MAKLCVIVVIALVALQGAVAKPKQAKPAEKSQLEELAHTAQNVVKDLTSTLEKNLPDSKKVVDSISTNAQTLATQVQSVVDKIKEEVKSNQGNIDDVLKQVQEKLTEASNKLNEAVGPDAAAKAKELKTNFDSGLQQAVAQVEKLAKAVEPEADKLKTDLGNAAKTLLDHIVETSKTLNTELKKSLSEGKH